MGIITAISGDVEKIQFDNQYKALTTCLALSKDPVTFW